MSFELKTVREKTGSGSDRRLGEAEIPRRAETPCPRPSVHAPPIGARRVNVYSIGQPEHAALNDRAALEARELRFFSSVGERMLIKRLDGMATDSAGDGADRAYRERSDELRRDADRKDDARGELLRMLTELVRRRRPRRAGGLWPVMPAVLERRSESDTSGGAQGADPPEERSDGAILADDTSENVSFTE